MKQFLYISFFLMGLQSTIQAQKISNKGTDFWAAFGHHRQMEVGAWFPTDSLKLVFDFTAEQAAHVVVTLDGTTYREEYDVPANSVLTSKKIPLPPNREPGSIYDTWLYTRTTGWPNGTNSEGIFKKKGIHIVSDVPIVVFERMYFTASSAATMLFPTDSWGYHYKCLAAPQSWVWGEAQTVAGSFSYFYIIANNNNTKIRINPSVPNRSGNWPANTPKDTVLQRGEVYQFLAAEKNATTMYDVTGTTITSVTNSNGECLPFAAFVGSGATAASCPGQPLTGSWEHLLQQIFPQQAWGKRYFTIPTSPTGNATTRNTNTFRVMVNNPATVVTRNGVTLTNLTNSTYEFTSNTADVIEADLPIQVAQYLPSQVNTCGYSGNGDPDYLILSPVEQGIKQASFMRTQVDQIDYNYLALTIPTAGLSSLKIDGQLNNYSQAYPHPSAPGYSVVVRMWFVRSNTDPRPPAQVTVESDSAFNAYSYGLGQAESYMFNAGTYINNLSGYPFIQNKYNTSDTASPYTCANTPVELSVLLRYKPTKIFWQLSKLADTITSNTDVTMNAPVSVETVMVNNLPYYRYQLPGTYTFNYPGTFTIPVFASEPTVEQCDHTEQIPYQLLVHDTLQTDFSLLFQNCKASETVQFTGNSKFNDSTLVQSWEWSFMNGATTGTASGQNVSHTFNAGTNSAALIAVDPAGCVADTTKTFTLSNKPATPEFTVTTTANCVDQTIRFTETVVQAGVQSWFWSFGNGDTTTLFTNGHTATHVYGKNDTLTVKHVAKYSATCISDTAIQTLIVYALPQLSITYPVGCLPVDGVIQFTSNVTTPDKQTIGSYLWNFGDPAATPGNPNTANIANPSHKYAAGNYKVTLHATTTPGCAGDSSWDISLQPRPVISYAPVLTPVCLNTTAPVSVATATITNGVTGTGIYKGPGTSSIGDFNPSVAGVGNHAIWYVFNSTGGCQDSAASSIWVHAVPDASFTAPANICLDQTATFTDQSTINTSVDANAKINTWTWNFDDGNNEVTYTNNNPIVKSFTNSKAYTVTLFTTSNNGCKSNTISKTLTVNTIPVADFSLPSGICMPDGQAIFTNKSTISDQSALSYLWDFGDGATSTQSNGSHVYATVNSYNITLKATSTPGCSADTVMSLPASAFVNKPVSGFEVTNDKPCEGATVNFTDKSTSTNSITSWDWTFGDGTKSTVQNPAKAYTNFGTYKVTLVVKDQSGCTSAAGTASDMQVRINPKIDAGPNISSEENSAVVLKATASNPSELVFSWQPAGLLNNASLLQPTYIVKHDQLFVLTATDKDGICVATDEMSVLILRSVTAPNAFSPNGDGINDVWVIKNLADYPNGSVKIFDRYGKQVYATQGYAKPWDGTNQGKPLPVGTYYYIIHVKQGETPLTGSVSIIR